LNEPDPANVIRSWWRQGPMLLGLSGKQGPTLLVLLAAGSNSIGSCWEAGLIAIGSYWAARPNSIGRKDIQLAQPQMKKNYHHPTFVQYKKNLINLFPLYHMKKITWEKRKKSKEKKKTKHMWVWLWVRLNSVGSGCQVRPRSFWHRKHKIQRPQ